MNHSCFHRIHRKFLHFRLHPIRVFCLHHITAVFDEERMHECDWMPIDLFKKTILTIRRDGVKFISMQDAYRHICKDFVRLQKYAVLSFDDGYASLKEILPWLEEQNIPVTLFINGKYLDGKSYRDNRKEEYLTYDDLFQNKSPLLEIGSHGWEHTDAMQMTEADFARHIQNNIDLLAQHPRFIPFHAYTWGLHSVLNDSFLVASHVIPVLMDGVKNYNDRKFIHRELL